MADTLTAPALGRVFLRRAAQSSPLAFVRHQAPALATRASKACTTQAEHLRRWSLALTGKVQRRAELRARAFELVAADRLGGAR